MGVKLVYMKPCGFIVFVSKEARPAELLIDSSVSKQDVLKVPYCSWVPLFGAFLTQAGADLVVSSALGFLPFSQC